MDNGRCRRATECAAAQWYVEIDANPTDHARSDALVEWLARSPDHEAAFERCEAAVMLASELAARGALGDAFDALPAGAHERWTDSTRIGSLLREPVRSVRGARPLPLDWLARPIVAWSVAAIAVVWALAATVESGAPSADAGGSARTTVAGSADASAGALAAGTSSAVGISSGAGNSSGADDLLGTGTSLGPDASPGSFGNDTLTPAGGAEATASARAPMVEPATAGDESVAAIEKWNPVGLLPGEIVVDAHSVAVLPFDGVLQMMTPDVDAGDAGGSIAAERIASQLHDEVVRQLSLIPGVFVVDGRSSAVYAGGEFGADQIAAFLGVRGVVAADVSLDGRIVTVSLHMTDAVNDGRRTETTFERPLDELPAVRTAIVSNIADALASTNF